MHLQKPIPIILYAASKRILLLSVLYSTLVPFDSALQEAV
jgi:hypothetical protein